MFGKFDLEGFHPAPRGVPQIEVTFELDASGVLNVAAVGKATGRGSSITTVRDGSRHFGMISGRWATRLKCAETRTKNVKNLGKKK